MYLQQHWINHVKHMYSGAHRDNVSSLLEAFNKLYKAGYTFTYTRSYEDNCFYILVELNGEVTKHRVNVLKPDEDAVGLTLALNCLHASMRN
ncbi:hypothetical protein [Ralstonia phage Reminis]|uniref:Uncharacterized protein n=1 Tax=Ralstonia phage Reminis TaxID=2662139 RepID=A0A5Q2UA47_9CAUD|nr:hypothetical protein [Ralstonia phage Reminis]